MHVGIKVQNTTSHFLIKGYLMEPFRDFLFSTLKRSMGLNQTKYLVTFFLIAQCKIVAGYEFPGKKNWILILSLEIGKF